MMDHHQALRAIKAGWPSAVFTLLGTDFVNMAWQDAVPKPTEAQIQAVWDTIASTPVPPTANDIDDEAQRRIYARLPQYRIDLMQARMIRLLHIGQANWTAEQTSQAIAIRDRFDWMHAVDQAATVLKGTLPQDYRSDTHWPTPTF